MKENQPIDSNTNNYQIMKFPKLEQIDPKGFNYADSIIKVFNIPSKESRQLHLSQAKKKVWRVVNSIHFLNQKQMQKYLPKKYIMDPYNSALRFSIDTIIVTLILFDLVIAPFHYFVDTHDDEDYAREIVFDSFFFIEIIANFFTGYYETNDLSLITDMKLIVINYLKQGFIFDIIYTLPFWLITPELVILRMIKIYRFPYIVSVIQQLILFLSSCCIQPFKLKIITKELFSFGFKVLYILHVFSCIYIYIAKQNPDSNWITGNGLDINDIVEIYISSIHVLTQTFSTTGFGDLKPMNNAEILFVSFSQAICCGLFSYFITCVLLVMITHLDTMSFKYKKQLNLYAWMKTYTHRLPHSTQAYLLNNTLWDNVTNYFDLHYGTRNNFEWINLFPFIKEIKPCHRKALMKSAFDTKIQHFTSFFTGMSQSTQNEIILKFKTHIQNMHYTLIKESKRIKRVFFIEKGTIVVLKEKRVICQLKEGQVFGLLGLINQYSDYSYEIAIDSEYAHLFSVSLRDLVSILSYDDTSYCIALHQAFEMEYSVKQMLLEMSKENDEGVANQNYLFNESMEIIMNIPNYTERKRDINEKEKNIDNNEPFSIEGLGMGNNEQANINLNKAIQREKELLDMELRLDLICTQMNNLNQYQL